MTEALLQDGNTLQSLAHIPERLRFAYPDTMRDWVKYDCDPEWAYEEVLREISQRWPEPYPAYRTVAHWRDQAKGERDEVKSQVWAKEWAKRARYLVPKLIVALDDTLEANTSALKRAVDSKNDRALPGITKSIVAVASELLSHLGAPTLEPTPVEPAQVEAEALRMLVAGGMSPLEAEAYWRLRTGAVQAALAGPPAVEAEGP